jgi:hypothetical protein
MADEPEQHGQKAAQQKQYRHALGNLHNETKRAARKCKAMLYKIVTLKGKL